MRTHWTVQTYDLPVDLIDEDEANAREHPDENIEDIVNSLDEYGLQRAIVVQAKDLDLLGEVGPDEYFRRGGRLRVLAGNGTYRAARRLGAQVISCHLSQLTALKAEAYAIADNRTGESSRWNWPRLGEKLRRFVAAGLPIEPTAWKGVNLDNILAQRPPSAFSPPSPPPPPAPAPTPEPPSPTTGPDEKEQHFDSWRTTPETLALVARICGVSSWDLDTASNVHSIVPARVSLLGGTEPLPVLATLRGKPAPGGKVKASSCGLRSKWPVKAACWWNPPYNAMPPWLMQVLWHAGGGGRGAGIVPGNTLDSAWGQALLLARTDLRAAAVQLAEDIGDEYTCHALEAMHAGEEMEHPDAPVRVFMIRGRVAFLDHRRGADAPPVKGNSGGSVLVFWGFPELDESSQPASGVWL